MSELVPLDAADADDFDDADSKPQRLTVPAVLSGQRLDKALATMLAEVSRSRLQQWIEASAVQVNGVLARNRQTVLTGDTIDVAPPPALDQSALVPEPIALDVVYEDQVIAVLDKPAGLVVHPGAGNWSATLANGLLARFAQTAALPRAGIVHRLDAGTSGLMVVALTLQAQTDLVRQLQARSVTREYWAIAVGVAPKHKTIDAPLARDPRNPLRFCVSRSTRAKPARTHLRCVQTVAIGRHPLSWIACRLESGRTHQIRVHLESIGHPLVGDPVYRRGRPTMQLGGGNDGAGWQQFSRQALHACRLGLVHPASGEAMQWFRAPPADLMELMRQCGFAGMDQPAEVFA